MTGGTRLSTRERLAARAFSRTAAYDAAIARYFAGTWPEPDALPREPGLRRSTGSARCATARTRTSAAALYAFPGAPADALVRFQMLQGKELSFNNLLDLDSAVTLARDFDGTAAVIVKHNNPCGAAIGETISEAFGRAFACDPLAAFGGIIAIRGTRSTAALASLVLQHFVEVVAADDFTEEALAFFAEEAEHPAAPRARLAAAGHGPRLEAHRGRASPPGLRLAARHELRLEGRVAAQAHGRRTGGAASSRGGWRGGSSPTRSSSPTPARPSASARAR